MVSLTLSVPPDLRKRMQCHPEIVWSEVVRAILAEQLDELERAERIASKSQLTEGDVRELAELADAGVLKRWKGMASEAGG